MEKDRNLAPLLIILVVLLVAMGANFTREGKWGEIFAKLGFSQEERWTLNTQAEPGTVIEGFPTEFLSIVTDAKVAESASYDPIGFGGEQMLYAKYETNAKVPDIFAAYVIYLTEHGYSVNNAEANSGVTVVSAKNDGREINIKISPKSARVNEVEVRVINNL